MDKEFEGKRLGVPLIMTAEEVFALKDYEEAYRVTAEYAKAAQNSMLEEIQRVRPEIFELGEPFSVKPAQPAVGL